MRLQVSPSRHLHESIAPENVTRDLGQARRPAIWRHDELGYHVNSISRRRNPTINKGST
jgi:hypothetical protein